MRKIFPQQLMENIVDAAAIISEMLDESLSHAISAQTEDYKNQGNPSGDCEECGQPIPPERLKVIGWARCCVKCQSQLDKEIPIVTVNSGGFGSAEKTVEEDSLELI